MFDNSNLNDEVQWRDAELQTADILGECCGTSQMHTNARTKALAVLSFVVVSSFVAIASVQLSQGMIQTLGKSTFMLNKLQFPNTDVNCC